MHLKKNTKVISRLFLLFFLFIACGREFPQPQYQKTYFAPVVFEEATAVWCTNCPEAALYMDSLKSLYGDSVIIISLHSSFEDPMGNESSEERLAMYGISGFPTIIINGIELISGAGSMDYYTGVVDRYINNGSPVSLTGYASLKDSTIEGKVEIAGDKDDMSLIACVIDDEEKYENVIYKDILLKTEVVERNISAKSEPVVNFSINVKDIVNDVKRIVLILQDNNTNSRRIWQAVDIDLFSTPSSPLILTASDTVHYTDNIKSDSFIYVLKNTTSAPVHINVSGEVSNADINLSVCSHGKGGQCHPIPYDEIIEPNKEIEYALDVIVPPVNFTDDSVRVDLIIASDSDTIKQIFKILKNGVR